jgi:hypothetical protein
MYRAAVSIRNFFNLKSYSRKVKELQPQAPITGPFTSRHPRQTLNILIMLSHVMLD